MVADASTFGTSLDRAIVRDISLVCAAAAVVGASFGAIAVGQGLPFWLPVLMSLVVFAGASQFVFVGLVAAGGGLVTAVLAGLLVNVRHLPFGFVVGDLIDGSLVRRLVGSHVMTDESVAFSVAQVDPARRRAVYWACGLGVFASWNVGVLVGSVAGAAIDDTARFGLDAAFPAVLLALILPALRDRGTRRAAGIGAAIALVTAPFLPVGLPILLSLVGLLALRWPDRRVAAPEDEG